MAGVLNRRTSQYRRNPISDGMPRWGRAVGLSGPFFFGDRRGSPNILYNTNLRNVCLNHICDLWYDFAICLGNDSFRSVMRTHSAEIRLWVGCGAPLISIERHKM